MFKQTYQFAASTRKYLNLTMKEVYKNLEDIQSQKYKLMMDHNRKTMSLDCTILMIEYILIVNDENLKLISTQFKNEMLQFNNMEKKLKAEINQQKMQVEQNQFKQMSENLTGKPFEDIEIDSMADQEKMDTFSDSMKKEDQKFFDIQSIPRNFQLRNLRSPLNSKGQIILIGIERSNPSHAQYLYDVLSTFKPEIILTQLPPDHPIFIRSDDDFQKAWFQFVSGDFQFPFLINSNPKIVQEIILNQEKIKLFINNNIAKSELHQIDSIYITEYMDAQNRGSQIIDVLKTPILFSYQNEKLKIPVIISGHPELELRRHISINTETQILYDLWKQKKTAYVNGKFNFDPQLLKPKIFLQPKIRYEIEIFKKTLLGNNRIISVVDTNSVNELEEEWIKDNHQSNIEDLRSLLIQNKAKEIGFQALIQKLVLLDLILYPFIEPYFIKYNQFPFLTSDSNSYRQSYKSLWSHFADKIQRGDLGKIPLEEKYTSSDNTYI